MPRAKKKKSNVLPVLAMRGVMIFPHTVLHFDVGRPKSVAALEKAMAEDQKIFLVTQQDADVEDPDWDDLSPVGTVATVKQVMSLPGNALRVLVEGDCRGTVQSAEQSEPYMAADIAVYPDEHISEDPGAHHIGLL